MSSKFRILVDGSSFIYKAWHSMPELSAPDGQQTGAVRGFANMLEALMREYGDDADTLVVFDAPGGTFRHELFPEYKAKRPSMPPELRSQIPLIHEWTRARGLPLFMEAGVEADDVIATLSRQLKEGEIWILSQDKDLAQCVNERVLLLKAVGQEPMGVQQVEEKYGIPPAQFPDWLALAGDKSDGIPGVAGIGPGKATRLLQKYGSLQAVMDAADELPGKDGERLRETMDKLPLYLELAKVRYEVPLDLAAASPSGTDEQALAALYARLGFSEAGSAVTEEKEEVAVLKQAEAVAQWFAGSAEAEVLGLRFAVDNPDKPHSPTIGIGLAASGGGRAYVPLALDEGLLRDVLPSDERGDLLQQVQQGLEAYAGTLAVADGKESLLRARQLELRLPDCAEDPLLMSYLLNPTAGRHHLHAVGQRYEIGLKPYEETMGKGAARQLLSGVPVEQAAATAGAEARAVQQLVQKLQLLLGAEPERDRLYRKLDLPLTAVLATMEETGVLIDCDLLRRHAEEMTEQAQKLQQRAWGIAGSEFNLDSPVQIGEVLFERLKLPVLGKTRGGQPSTAENVLQRLADDGEELPYVLLRYRGLRKLISTYAEKLPQQMRQETGRVHTTYHQATTATGRLSSTDPNLQNIPIRTAEGRRIRHAFCAPKGSVLIAADYSQIELRVMAHLSQDKTLLQAFAAGRDVHAATAQELFGATDGDWRRRAKAINFGLMYGMSAFGLARQLKVPQSEAQTYIQSYFERFPGVLKFMDSIRQQAAEAGYVETLWGRRLYLPEIRAGNPARRKAAERAAINAPMQGTAADIIKQAMLAVSDWLCGDGAQTGGRLLMQVHDELVLEVPEGSAEQVAATVTECMSSAAELRVPLDVDVGIGTNWEEAKKA